MIAQKFHRTYNSITNNCYNQIHIHINKHFCINKPNTFTIGDLSQIPIGHLQQYNQTHNYSSIKANKVLPKPYLAKHITEENIGQTLVSTGG